MSAPGSLQKLAFGDLGSELWGAALVHPARTFVCLGAEGAVVSVEARLERTSPGEEWRVAGDGTELVVAPVAEPAKLGGASIEGFDQLCRVSGRFLLGDRPYELSSLGCRGVRAGSSDVAQYESLREVAAWFEPGEGLVVSAFRPRKSKGQDADVVLAAVLGPESPPPVEDPRLSTTYTAAGWPARAGLELWLTGEEEDRPQLRRAAGEAAGRRLEATWGEFTVRAELFRWTSRGGSGAGVYLLASSR